MSDPYDTAPAGTRFLMCGYDAHPKEFASGDWVRYSDYARLQSEVERLRKAGEWQPIETAPKDGSDVLCISGNHMYVAWIDSRGYWHSEGNSRFIPDYWMPLPNPPAAKDGKPTA